MPRKGSSHKRISPPDAKYSDVPMETRRRITRFINGVMRHGKKSVAERIVYEAFEIVAHRMKDDPVKIFDKALANAKPRLEVRSRRVGGATYQVPMEVRTDRSIALAMRWITGFARQRSDKSMQNKLASELIDAAAGRGGAVKKREDTHRMAEANKAFSHYRW